MIRPRPARARPADRVATETDKTPVAQVFTFPAPVGGLLTNAPLSAGAGAPVLDNFWPTASGIEPRGGLEAMCSIPSRVWRLFQYRAGQEFFATSQTAIYKFTVASVGALTAVVTGQTNGKWSSYEMQTSGGSFLVCVNGENKMQTYNGTAFQQVTAASTPLAITGVDTALLVNVWGHSNRLFFIERNSMRAWYLGVNSVAGVATVLPLSGVFRRGGALIFGGTWSADSGDGGSDRCAFVTSAGEVAVYSGSDPGSLATWSLDGVYDIGETLGSTAVTQIGGDIVFGTIDGLIPLSGIVQRDPAQINSVSLSQNITPDWVNAVRLGANDWRVTKWVRESMLIAAPQGSVGGFYISNLDTGAWARVTGWDVGDIENLGDGLYLGGRNGQIYKAWVGGSDNGEPFVCRTALKFEHFGSPSAIKVAGAMQMVWRTKSVFTPQGSIATNYSVRFPTIPDANTTPSGVDAVWDVSSWDQDFWASEQTAYEVYSKWRGVSGTGFAFSPMIQVTCASPGKIVAILERVDLSYITGAAIT